MATALVIENDPSDDLRRLGEWLAEGGLDQAVLRPYAGDELPEALDGYVALIVMGGRQQAYPAPDGTPGAPWFPALESLLRDAVRQRVPTLAICLGAQLLAAAHGGTVRPGGAGPELGAALVARRDAAAADVLFARVPFLPDVFQWHNDEIAELPAGAVLLATSTRYPHQAFRLGERAWGLQFHIECDLEMLQQWAAANRPLLKRLRIDSDRLLTECAAVMPDVEEIWHPFAIRFAALARGEPVPGISPRTQLPLLGG